MERKFPGERFRKFGDTLRGCHLFRKLCKFAIFYSALILLAAITTIIPDKDGGDVYSKMDQCSVCFYICYLNLEVIEKFEANKRVRAFSTLVQSTEKVYTIRPRKFPEIHTAIFGRMEAPMKFRVFN